MVEWDSTAFNIAAFVCSLFVLEFGADKFIKHTAIVSRRTRIPEGVIGLLTAGAEWEELAVVIASLSRGRSSLAVGNVVGSTISNILGAFSLGLLFHQANHDEDVFDRTSKVYSLLLLLLCTIVVVVTYLETTSILRVFGGVLIGIFVIYVAFVAWQIGQGSLIAPELSDSDSEDEVDNVERHTGRNIHSPQCRAHETQALLRTTEPDFLSDIVSPNEHNSAHSLGYHLSFLFLGFLCICLSSYVLSHASISIIDELGISDMLFGVIFLSIATTLPEKLIAVLSGSRDHMDILVATTVGSNIFLLSLCMGILLLSTAGKFDAGASNAVELGVMWISTLALVCTVWFGGKWNRWIGAIMVGGYVAFLTLEFLVTRKG